MLWNDKEEYDVAGIVRKMVPPTGMTQVYRPGREGFLERDLTHPAGQQPQAPAAIDLSSPGGPQRRLEQLETRYPQGQGALPVMQSPTQTMNIGTAGPTSALPTAPKHQIPDDMMEYFNRAVSSITSPSADTDYLKKLSQGFGLIGMSPRQAAQARIGANQALANIEGIKRNAATNLANTLSHLMVDPSKFNLDVYGKQLQYDLGRRGQDIASRETAIKEMKAPWEIREKSMVAPTTVGGRGPSGEEILFGWDPEKQRWGEMTRGALPVGIKEGEKLFDPTTKQVIAEGGEKPSRFRESLGQSAWKSYEQEMKGIDESTDFFDSEKFKPAERERRQAAKAKAQAGAWKRLQEHMGRLGYGELFGEGQAPREGEVKQGQFGKYIFKNGEWQTYEEGAAVPKRKPNETIEEYAERVGW